MKWVSHIMAGLTQRERKLTGKTALEQFIALLNMGSSNFKQFGFGGSLQYNKTYEANKKLDKDEKITEDLFRFEAEVNAKYVAKNYGLPIQIVSDLKDHTKFSQSLDLIFSLYSKINKDHLDYSKLKCNDYRNAGIFKDKKLSHEYRKNHPHTYKQERSKFNALMKDTSYQKKDNLREEISDTIQTMKNF